MDRRLLLAALACLPAARLRAQDEAQRPRLKISARQLHESLSARFPVRMGVPGLLALEVSAPSLHLLPSRNRLGAGLQLQATGRQLQPMPPGELDVVFALRYEPSDRSIRAFNPEVLDVAWPGLPPEILPTLRGMLPAMAREAVGEVVLHKFSDRDLALADTMGVEPRELTVLDDGLLVVFGDKRPPRPPAER
ncbi:MULTISPECIES: DUF1439 domain-containing protein [Ramlibacter]|uniref:DUF1439 domain-containing protein n=1 Tax=Ramlibacter pinisoli TaxID=2682844 RepID=A0A6N8IYJ2_9BURK|nr:MULTISPECIES: DUF1439 domain-containing protein [Ramlibacter]MBA2961119.1 DUF1439 domain-containing protein [Ramlibacter sp. CGMCC 1.13660]MVQ31063.1 DUF1439 domain-containing protein [Ramlibacter pinisoli]